MNKKYIVIVIISLIVFLAGGFLLSTYFRNREEEMTKKAILNTATEYLINFGTYDATKTEEEYYNSFKKYITAESQKGWETALADKALDETTREHERATNYRIKTTLISADISFQSKERAEVVAKARKSFSSTIEKQETREETLTIFLIKKEKSWLVEKTSAAVITSEEDETTEESRNAPLE